MKSVKKIYPSKRLRIGGFDMCPYPGKPHSVWITNLDTHEQMEVSKEEYYEFLEEAIEKFFNENM